ncbi:MAG: phosphatase PAP2 family protein [Chlamydiae bacterium]|nr:phosphatase PAP2 family protein [Chlamydiota bacterium]MBI3276686.1 phosphatase PAP2 family protein [Chlamydiota bacterium]
MEFFAHWDQAVFYSINHLQNPFLDALSLWVVETRQLTWLVLMILFTFLSKRKDRWRIAIVGILLLVSVDFLTHLFLKPFFHRLRPCHVLQNVILRVPCPASASFPSGHVFDIFTLAVFFGFYYPKWIGTLSLVTILVSLSRIYIGVHYPLDVLGSAALGTLAAFLGRMIEKKLKRKQS